MDFWRAKQLRVTAFPKQPIPFASSTLWEELEIGEPERQEKTKLHVTNQGAFCDHWLLVTNAGLRLDWNFLPNPAAELPGTSVDVGDFGDSAKNFVEFLSSWISKKCPPLSRLAFGAEVLHSVNERLEGYRELSKFLPFQLDLQSQDFSYQINRPRDSKACGGLKVNRLTKWSVSATAVWQGDLSQGLPNVGPISEMQGVEFANRLEMDINNSAIEGRFISGAEISALLAEFLEIAVEISINGDKP